MRINDRIHELKTSGIRRSYHEDSGEEKSTGKKVMYGMIFLVTTIFVFILMLVLLGNMDTSGCSDAEITIVKTLIPLAVAIMTGTAVLIGIVEE